MALAYYNENDPYAAQWLRNLIAAEHIAMGFVDERDIREVRPDEIREFTQCHFFAGIGVWSHALRGAGWPDDRPVWTGSCPCQPFSAAGAGLGFTDERHLWPHWFHLISECRPATVFGEQVASKGVDPWIDLVQDDMEALGHAFGAIAFPSAGVGAPHIRDRTYWMAYADDARSQGRHGVSERSVERAARSGGVAGGLADTAYRAKHGSESRTVVGEFPQSIRTVQAEPAPAGPTNGFWRDADWLFCRDGKWRPVEPGTFPLAHGAPARVGRLRAYGNAINAQAATEFIKIVMECIP